MVVEELDVDVKDVEVDVDVLVEVDVVVEVDVLDTIKAVAFMPTGDEYAAIVANRDIIAESRSICFIPSPT